MRKITKEAINAFMNHKRFKKANTEVYIGEFTTLLILFGNTIAYHHQHNGAIEITICKHNTRTTRERLNGIPGVCVRSIQCNLSLNNRKWDGDLVNIKDYE